MLKWTAAEGERGLSRTKVPGPPGSVPAMPADIICALKANPEACAEVMRALAPLTMANANADRARAEKAERERDEARAERDMPCAHLAEERRLESELDALKAKLAEAERVKAGARSGSDYWNRRAEEEHSGREELGRILNRTCAPAHKYAQEYSVGHVGEDVVAVVVRDARALRARLAAREKVVEAARSELTTAISSANGIDHDGPGSASFSRIFPEDAYPTTEPEADAFVKARMRLWLHTWVTAPMRRALDALDGSALAAELWEADKVMLAQAAVASKESAASVKPEPAGGYVLAPPRVDPADLAEEPLTRADLDALEERIVERVARAFDREFAGGSRAIADELRRKQ